MAEEDKSKDVVIASEESAVRDEKIVSSTTSDGETTIYIYEHYCKGCEICVEVCPKGVLDMVTASDRWEGTMVKVININACNACMLCEYECPDFAIEVYNKKKEKKKMEKKTL
ncbi:MAG: 4Fe-4S binding protein [Candidatus Electryoneaceae bacterium]|nr:4Fe-4S binding protein [Candidatus Electryoneaceae bacterium]